MNRNLCALGLLVVAFSSGACGSSGGSGTGGAGGKTGTGGATGSSGGAGGAAVPTVASACASYKASPIASPPLPDCTSLSAVMTACIKFCIAERDCKASSTIEDSMDYRCFNLGGTHESLDTKSTACQSANTAFFNCLATQTTVCDTANMAANLPGDCGTQAEALGTACN